MKSQPQNIPQGVTLEMILTELIRQYGWPELSKRISIRCFSNDPSIKSSLTFLRRTPWARKQVESLYLATLTGAANFRNRETL